MVSGRGTLISRVSKHNKKDEKKMGEPHYISAPVKGEQIHGWFEFVDKTPLTVEQEDLLAMDALTSVVMKDRSAVWFNPETDRSVKSGAKVHGAPLELDGKPVRYVPTDEAAIFYRPDNVA